MPRHSSNKLRDSLSRHPSKFNRRRKKLKQDPRHHSTPKYLNPNPPLCGPSPPAVPLYLKELINKVFYRRSGIGMNLKIAAQMDKSIAVLLEESLVVVKYMRCCAQEEKKDNSHDLFPNNSFNNRIFLVLGNLHSVFGNNIWLSQNSTGLEWNVPKQSNIRNRSRTLCNWKYGWVALAGHSVCWRDWVTRAPCFDWASQRTIDSYSCVWNYNGRGLVGVPARACRCLHGEKKKPHRKRLGTCCEGAFCVLKLGKGPWGFVGHSDLGERSLSLLGIDHL